MTADLFLFDDSAADGWAPFAASRPVGELVFGRWRLRERVQRALGASVAGHCTRAWLDRYAEPGCPRVRSISTLPAGAALWCSRAVPGRATTLPAERANLWVDDRLAGVVLGEDFEPLDLGWQASPVPLEDASDHVIGGTWLERPWDLVAKGVDRLADDLTDTSDGPLPEACHRIGDAPVSIAPDARVEPGVLFDTRDGPIHLGSRVEVRAGARLAGPIHAGPDSRLLGGAISALSCGPFSYVRGEIEEVTALGYVNKAHDGFLGHAYVGQWVNLGAMTTNSDLKNNYGSIRVGPPDGVVDTGLTKLGCLIGDHAKTGIGVLLNTGTIMGTGSNVYGAELPPKWIEPFSWGQGADFVTYRREAFLETAATVAARRGVDPDAEFSGWLGAVWDAATGAS
ncbi:MAG: hypothetical protein MJB57_04075 [Gemmatimonadetes bacterium]|nr:hypothetical protein [Gemmatimonadota bacterium]